MTKSQLINREISTEEVKEIIIKSIQEKQGSDIVCLDLKDINEAITDYFIICHADSTVQVKAISDEINRQVKEQTGQYCNHTEGYENLEWVLLDYMDIVVHVFYHKRREFYKLEELWSDANVEVFEQV